MNDSGATCTLAFWAAVHRLPRAAVLLQGLLVGYARAVAAPSYDDTTLSHYFQPVDLRMFDDPIVGAELLRLRGEDPDVVLAVADVDRSQIRDSLARTPEQRLDAVFRLAATLEELRRGVR
jgi:hypothetical protein